MGVRQVATALVLVTVAVLFLAYSNGANDNFKGVATLFGSGTATYPAALAWATLTTLAGSLLALVLAGGLVESFKGKGLVPDEGLSVQPNMLQGGGKTLITVMRLKPEAKGQEE